jgi:hypothetical protein
MYSRLAISPVVSRAEIEPLDQHVANLAPRCEVVYRPLVSALLDHADHLVALLGGVSSGRELQDTAHHLGRVRGVVHQRLGPDGDLVTKDGGDLVRVASAADVAQQRHPINGFAQFSTEARLLT